MVRIFFLFLFVLSIWQPASCQRSNSATAAPAYFSFSYDNDFFSATDRYYTQGIFLSFVHPAIGKSFLTGLLIKLKYAQYFHGIHLRQDVFTPRSIRYMNGAVFQGERPFTATFYASQSVNSIKEKRRLFAQFDAGVLGPEALGEQEQKGIHKALNNIEPQGWNNQLSTGIILNYRVSAEQCLVDLKALQLLVNAGVRAGTLYNDLNAAIVFRTGLFNGIFFQTDDGTVLNVDRSRWRVYLWGKGGARIVGYNATLQGGVFSKNIYQLEAGEITRAVLEVSGGVAAGKGNTTLAYSRSYITKEFDQGVDHGWGRCSFILSF